MTNARNIIAKIEARLEENKKAAKTYAAYDKAALMGAKLSEEFNAYNGTNCAVEFIPVYLPQTERWTVVFNLSKWCQQTEQGTYLGWFAERGFFSI